MTYNEGREQVPSFATEAPTGAAEAGAPNRQAGAAAGSGGTPPTNARASGRRGSRPRWDSARPPAAAGLAKGRYRVTAAVRPSALAVRLRSPGPAPGSN